MDDLRVGHIRVLKTLGEGGMGTVYVGLDETLQRKVALKVIRKDKRLPRFARERFLREARILSKLEHPNICRIHDYIEHETEEYLVLELIDGANLLEVAQRGELDASARLDLAIQLTAALVAAHEKGIVHRDLKPDNVMRTRDGVLKVLDFGLAHGGEELESVEEAQGFEPTGESGDTEVLVAEALSFDEVQSSLGSGILTEVGSVMGTPLFMSPEQARGAHATTASDMYSLGLLLQWLYSGKYPYDPRFSLDELLRLVREGETREVEGAPSEVRTLIESLKCFAPAARPTARETLAVLERIREAPRRRMRRILVALLLFAVVLAGVKYTVDLQREQQRTAQKRGQAELLIAFMLGDLREKLEPLGRLDVLSDVGARALEYLSTVEDDELGEHDLAMWSKALYQIGLVRIDEGDLPTAMEAFERSLELANRLAQSDEAAEVIEQQGFSHFGVASVHFYQGEVELALASFEASRDHAAQLVARDPTRQDWLLELASEEGNVGLMLEQLGRTEEAHAALRRQLDTNARIAASDPANTEWKEELARGHILLGPLEEERGQLLVALEHYTVAEGLLAELVERDARNADWLETLALSRSYLGSVLEYLHRLDEARLAYAACLESALALVDRDPSNSLWLDMRASARRGVGRLALKDGDFSAAEQHLVNSFEGFRDLAASDPTKLRWQRELAASRIELGWVWRAQDDLEAALSESTAASSSLASLAATESNDATIHLRLSESRILTGRLLVELGRDAEARAQWRAARDTIAPFAAESKSAKVLAAHAISLSWLGEDSRAQPIEAQLEDQGYYSTLLNEAGARR